MLIYTRCMYMMAIARRQGGTDSAFNFNSHFFRSPFMASDLH